MDLNALMSTILSDETVNGVGKKTGASANEVRGVLGSALPLLLNGANAQAANDATAAGFSGALQQHAQNDTSVLSSFLGGVDLDDGAKIVAHLLGGSTAAQTQTLAQQSGVSEAKTGNILSAAAPLLMSLIGQQAGSENSSTNVAGLMGNLMGSGDMTGLLAGMLGGGSAQSSSGKKNSLLGKLLGLLK